MRTLKNFNRIWPEPTPYPTWFSWMTWVPMDYTLWCLQSTNFVWGYWLTNWTLIITMNMEQEWYRLYMWKVMVYNTNFQLQDTWCVNIPQINPISWTSDVSYYKNIFYNWDPSYIVNTYNYNSVDDFVRELYRQNENNRTINFDNTNQWYKFLDYNTWNVISNMQIQKWALWNNIQNSGSDYIITLSDNSKFVISLYWCSLSEIRVWTTAFVPESGITYRNRLANDQILYCVTK